jgi:mannose-6-phosphate isomerase-like protein (cupin superfamily)
MEGFMRATVCGALAGFALVVAASWAMAQRAPQADKIFTSANDIQDLMAKAKAELKPGQFMVSEPILRLAPYGANLEYRVAVGPAAVHIHEAEVFYVIDGSCTMTVGGKLTEPKQTNPENLSGTGIEGGSTQKLAKGDFYIVPENTPHWVSAIEERVVFMTLHVPRPIPSGSAELIPVGRATP